MSLLYSLSIIDRKHNMAEDAEIHVSINDFLWAGIKMISGAITSVMLHGVLESFFRPAYALKPVEYWQLNPRQSIAGPRCLENTGGNYQGEMRAENELKKTPVQDGVQASAKHCYAKQSKSSSTKSLIKSLSMFCGNCYRRLSHNRIIATSQWIASHR